MEVNSSTVNTSMMYSQEFLLSSLNFYLMHRRVQTLIVTAVILFLGLAGNGLVLGAYWNLLHRRRVKELKGRYFMPVLALADMASVFVGGVFFLYTDFHRATFFSDVGCRLGMFCAFSTNTVSILILLLITVSRYMKICMPHGRKMTLSWKRRSIIIVIIFSSITCIPFLYFSGTVVKTIKFAQLLPITHIPPHLAPYKVTFQMCFATTKNNVFWKLFYNALFLVQILNIGIMIVLYMRMGRVIYSRCDTSVAMKVRSGNKTGTSEKSSTTRSKEEGSSEEDDDDLPQKTEDSEEPNSIVFSSTVTNDTTTGPGSATRRRSKRGRKHKAWRNARNRFTMMFIVIVIIYAVTNIPTFLFLYLFMENKQFKEYFTRRAGFEEYNLILLLVRVHLINNIVNPYIYGYFDFSFRREVKRICFSVIVRPARLIMNRKVQ